MPIRRLIQFGLICLLGISTLKTPLSAQGKEWSETKLREIWAKSELAPCEGIYEKTLEEEFSPKYRVAIRKQGSKYYLLFLHAFGQILGADEFGKVRDYTSKWEPGDIKGELTPTSTPCAFQCRWYMADKSPIDAIVTVDAIGLKVIWPADGTSDLFLKIFPSFQDVQANKPRASSHPAQIRGTAFLISSDGLLVTNHHVIEDGKRFFVRNTEIEDGKLYTAEIVLDDPSNDLSVLRVHGTFQQLPFGVRSRPLEAGERVFTLGYPLPDSMGQEVKLTDGLVSSKSGFQGDLTAVQISVPIQPGNSGGPLFDERGNLVGIVNSKHSAAENATYAVKVQYLLTLLTNLSSPPILKQSSLIKDLPLVQKVKALRKFVFEIEVTR